VVKGFATNLKHPEFTLKATAKNFGLDESIGNINMELVANGDYENYRYFLKLGIKCGKGTNINTVG